MSAEAPTLGNAGSRQAEATLGDLFCLDQRQHAGFGVGLLLPFADPEVIRAVQVAAAPD